MKKQKSLVERWSEDTNPVEINSGGPLTKEQMEQRDKLRKEINWNKLMRMIFTEEEIAQMVPFEEDKMKSDKETGMKRLFELIPKADAGDEQAMLEAANTMVIDGLVNNESSIGLDALYSAYLKKLAASGSTIAYIMLGDCYSKGTGVELDPVQAIYWYQKAADAGEGFGYECIAMMYYEGRGLDVDYKQAFKYFSKSEKKSACSLYTLGEMYRLGQYVNRDPDTAKMYYEKIAYSDEPTMRLDDYYSKACERLGVTPGPYNADLGNNADDADNGVKEEQYTEEEDEVNPIIGFFHEYDEYGCFSNWYDADFVYAGKGYANSEQYMMYQKVILFHQYELAEKIMHTDDPEKCKKIASQHFDNFDAELWDKVSYQIVKRGVRAKFQQNSEIRSILLGTGNAVLAECSPYDRKWGIGIDIADPAYRRTENWIGKNYLGRILMEVRAEIKQEEKYFDERFTNFTDVTDEMPIPEWNMRAGDLKMIPAFYATIHAYADILQDHSLRKKFYYDATLKEWDDMMRTNQPCDLPIIGFYEMKQDVYDTAQRLSL